LNARRKWTNGLLDVTKKVVINWWTYETRVNPNKKDVTHKRIAIGVFEKRPTHYLMESQVHIFCSIFHF
jgi:hypothetical protein